MIFKGPLTPAERLAAREEELRVLTATQRARHQVSKSFTCLLLCAVDVMTEVYVVKIWIGDVLFWEGVALRCAQPEA